MKAKKRLEIVWETHEITTISFKGNYLATFFCQWCRSEVPYLSLPQAAVLLQTTEREIFSLTETGEVHYLETEAGALLVCGNSLSTKTKNIKH